MKGLDKPATYAKLFEIQHNTDGKEARKYINLLSKSEGIPSEIIIFINKHERLPQLETYNRIYDRRNSNPLFKTIMKENPSNEDMSLALSSILTQCLIRMKELNESDRKEFAEIMNVKYITRALDKYMTENDNINLIETFSDIKDMFNKLFIEN